MSKMIVEVEFFPLLGYLTKLTSPSVLLSFQQIEVILGAPLPESAYKYHCWWVNSLITGSHAFWWLGAGFEVSEVRLGDYVEFRKIQL